MFKFMLAVFILSLATNLLFWLLSRLLERAQDRPDRIERMRRIWPQGR